MIVLFAGGVGGVRGGTFGGETPLGATAGAAGDSGFVAGAGFAGAAGPRAPAWLMSNTVPDPDAHR